MIRLPELTRALEGALKETLPADISKPILAGLVREAEEQAAYAPHGAFRVRLPDSIPLRLPDDCTLLLYVSGRSVYYGFSHPSLPLFGAIGVFSAPLVYQADEDTRHEIPTMEITLAAIWRDMRVAAERAFPDSDAPERMDDERPSQPARRRKSQSASTRSLPRYSTRGYRFWGSQAEREYLTTRHSVGAFRRRLPEGYKRGEDALDKAIQFGIALPEGYTVVQPHERGQGTPENPIPVIRCRGLASLIALSRSFS